MHLPQPIATDIHEESFAGVTYHIRGQLVPELQVELTERRVMHEHHVLLWKETGVDIELRKLKGGVKRKIAGLDFFVTRAVGPGRIAFSRDSPWTSSGPPTATPSCGCTGTATSSRCTSTPASSSTSRRGPGCSRTPPSGSSPSPWG